MAIGALLLPLQAAGWRDALGYRRVAVLRGQVWRLLTGNLVHLGWVHLARDVAGLFLIWGLLGRSMDERSWVWVALASGLAVGLGLLAFSPNIAWYVGISGVLFGVFCAGALSQFQERPMYTGALLVGMTAVIAWTMYAGALPGETTGLGGAAGSSPVRRSRRRGICRGASRVEYTIRDDGVACWSKLVRHAER